MFQTNVPDREDRNAIWPHSKRVSRPRYRARNISFNRPVYPGPEMNINSLSLQIYTVIIKLAVGSERERERAVDRSRPSRIFHAPQKCPPSPSL